MNDRVIIDIQDHIAHVKLNRPDKMNALDDAMFEAICAAGDEIKGNDTIRAVVLSGEGKGFCAGLDLGNFAKMAGGGDKPKADAAVTGDATVGRLEKRTHGLANRPQYVTWVWREVEVPVIAAMHGVALGGGCQMSMGADIRYAHPDTKIAILEMKWGLVPDMGATPFLVKCLGDDVARELTYTNRTILAPEAKELGLITKVCDDPVAAAFETAGDIATKNPDAVRGAKRILNAAQFAQADEILLSESREQDKVIGTPNQIERVMSVMEKRAPIYNK